MTTIQEAEQALTALLEEDVIKGWSRTDGTRTWSAKKDGQIYFKDGPTSSWTIRDSVAGPWEHLFSPGEVMTWVDYRRSLLDA